MRGEQRLGFSPIPVAVEVVRERLSGVRLLHRATCSGVPCATNAAAVFATFRAEIDEPVGVADHVEIVLDDDDGVA